MLFSLVQSCGEALPFQALAAWQFTIKCTPTNNRSTIYIHIRITTQASTFKIIITPICNLYSIKNSGERNWGRLIEVVGKSMVGKSR